MADAIIRWTDDNWKTRNNISAKDTGLGIYITDIVSKNKSREKIQFTFCWKKTNHWENEDFEVNVCSKKNNK